MADISLGHLAYFSIVLRSDKETGDLLHSHFKVNRTVYRNVLAKARSLDFDIPRRAGGNDIERLAKELQKEFEKLSTWKKVHWVILANLLVFDAQLDRNAKRCEDGRWIHVDAHCRAVYFAAVESRSPGDSLLATFLNPNETQKIVDSFNEISSGQEFGSVVQSKKLAPHGLREATRNLLELDESITKNIKPATRREVERQCMVKVKIWDKARDPEASSIRVRGIVHECLLRKEMMRQEIVSERVKEQEVRKLLNIRRRPPRYHRLTERIEPITAQVYLLLAFVLTMLGCILSTPQDSFSVGIAWWYFQLGALVTGAVTLSFPFIFGADEAPRVDFSNLIGVITIFSVLLFIIQPETFHFGIAWWHSILGGLVSGVACIVIYPFLRSLMTKEKVQFALGL